MFINAATNLPDHKGCLLHKIRWDIRRSGVFRLEWRDVSLGRISYLYLEPGVFNSGKVVKIEDDKNIECHVFPAVVFFNSNSRD